MRLDACPPPVVVVVARRQRHEGALLEERWDAVREQDLGGDAVRLVLSQAPVGIPVAVRGRCQEICKWIHVALGPRVELVVPARSEVRPVVRDVSPGVSVGGDDGVPAIRFQRRRQAIPSSADGGS